MTAARRARERATEPTAEVDHDDAQVETMNGRQAATYLHMSERHLARLRKAGGGPTYTRNPRTNRVRYATPDLDAWAAAEWGA